MPVNAEFATVDLILTSTAETRGVDAFALALIKVERQIRKLFTHLVFQFPCFFCTDVPVLRRILAKNKAVYFEGVEQGINYLLPCTVNDLVGSNYEPLHAQVCKAIVYRNKIFHGQLTEHYLQREDLISIVNDLRVWCESLAAGAMQRIGYDGFIRNSFQKSTDTNIPLCQCK